MEHYYKNRPTTASPTPTQPTADHVLMDSTSILSEFDHHQLMLLRGQKEEDEGWQAELRRYLKDLPSDVTKDTDVVEWWQVWPPFFCFKLFAIEHLQSNGHRYPTLRWIAIDFLACQASSVPCERLFSGSGEIATKRRAQLGAQRFEELQIMKFAWRNNIWDLAAWNSAEVEVVDDELKEYHDLLTGNGEQAVWENTIDKPEAVSMF